jgi:hypothetical protein
LENGAYWYRYSGRSFGFAGNQSVVLNYVDVSSSNPTERLSWHYNFSYGGYRIGGIINLNSNSQYYKIII